MGLTRYDIKEIRITYKMAYSNPKYNKDTYEILNILAGEYNVPIDCLHELLFGKKINKNIGRNLRLQRFKRNLRQDEVAKELGISICMIGRYERSENLPSEVALQKLVDFYGTTIEEISEENNNAPLK